MHNKPTISQTILISNMYLNPVLNAPMGPDGLPQQVPEEEVQDHYEVSVAAWAGGTRCVHRMWSGRGLHAHRLARQDCSRALAASSLRKRCVGAAVCTLALAAPVLSLDATAAAMRARNAATCSVPLPLVAPVLITGLLRGRV
jgi:hypothetical protein